jgi:hypothetical protein
LDVQIPTPKCPTLRFELSHEAALHNKKLLQAHNNSLHEYLLSQKGTFLYFGSEFRPVEVIDDILPSPKLAKSQENLRGRVGLAFITYHKGGEILEK